MRIYKNLKKMKINILYIGIFLITCIGCKRNEIALYAEKPALYFTNITDQDSVMYSFAGKSLETDTIYIDLKLLGSKLNQDLKYKVQVNPANTSAIESLHFKKLADYYFFPSQVFDSKLPLIIYNKDEELANRSVRISLDIISTDDIDAGYPNRTTATIVVTNQLIKPNYWDNLLFIYYGPYSKVKHEICIRLQGHDFVETLELAGQPPYSFGYWMSQGRVAAKYFTDNVVYDENKNQILPWPSL